MRNEKSLVKSKTKISFLKLLIASTSEEGILAIDGLYLGFVSEGTINSYFEKADDSQLHSNSTGFSYMTQLTDKKKIELNNLFDQEPDIIHEIIHFIIIDKGLKAFESYDNFSVNNSYGSLLSQINIQPFIEEGMKINTE